VDDGSSDKTVDLMQKLCLEDHRIKYFLRPDNRTKGANSCRNIGIENANGDFVSFLDSDDIYHPNHLHTSLTKILQSKADGVFGSIQEKTNDQIISKVSRPTLPNELMINYLLGSGVAQTSSLFFTYDSIATIKWDESIFRHQDFDLCCRYSTQYFLVPKNEVTVTVDKSDYHAKSIDYSSQQQVIDRYREGIDPLIYAKYCSYMYQEATLNNAEKKYLKFYSKQRFKQIEHLPFQTFMEFKSRKRTAYRLLYLIEYSFRLFFQNLKFTYKSAQNRMLK